VDKIFATSLIQGLDSGVIIIFVIVPDSLTDGAYDEAAKASNTSSIALPDHISYHGQLRREEYRSGIRGNYRSS
jgi:hypothetical protein